MSKKRAELTGCRIFAEDKCRTANEKIVGWTDLGILCKSMRQSNTKDFSLGGRPRPWTASKPSKHGQVSLTRTPCRPHNKLRRRWENHKDPDGAKRDMLFRPSSPPGHAKPTMPGRVVSSHEWKSRLKWDVTKSKTFT